MLSVSSGWALAESEVELKIKPHLCVISGTDDSCSGAVEFKWQAEENLDACLYREKLDEHLVCWQNKASGNYELMLNTESSQRFMLKQQGDMRLLAESEFKVIKDQKRYRRARRNPWSFF